ncbi:MAG: zinc dependent phospholipase C family protein [Desulfobacterales bacterium]|nr:zinc dependent phospholipase C family protein [Desulfobacterales bacterium]
MPKLPTHWIFAEDVLHRMPPGWAVRRAVDRYPNLYRYGAVAPDTPFYLFRGPGSRILNRQAEGFHETGGGLESFLASALGRRTAAPKQQMALAAGILTHAAADAVFHPMIYYFSGSGTDEAECRHHRLESFIDLYFSRNFLRPEVSLLEPILQGLEVGSDTLLGWLADLFELDRRRHRPHLRLALGCNGLFLRLFRNRGARLLAGRLAPVSPAGLKAYLVHFYPCRLPPWERLFPEPITYRNPATGLSYRPGMAELGKTAVDTALDVLERFEAGKWRLSVLFPNGWNLHTGIASRPKSAMRFFDTSRPLREIIGVDFGPGDGAAIPKVVNPDERSKIRNP